MVLRLIGKDPNSPNTNSPTVWVDDQDGSLVIQGWRIVDPAMMAAIEAAAPVPEHETVLRLPARMAPIIEEALRGRGPAGL